MKKIFLFSTICLWALSLNAQRCAVLEFKAGVGISQNDVDGISAIFITYFRPSGYTMVERTQIDKVIEEQGFQRSKMTQQQMVRVGQILNVSKIVVGDINVVMGQYNVDVRVINVETGTIAATEGATFATSSYRTSMQSVAQKLAGKIAITPGSTKPQPTTQNPTQNPTPKQRTSVEVLYGYLKIFPNELGVFQSEPTSVIAQINKQAQHGYNNWRIPTNEELSLMRANNYLGGGEYMTKESEHGIVLLVSDGEDYATLYAEEQARIKAEQERQAKLKAEQERKDRIKAQGYVDLGLPSGTMWKNKNEEGGFYTDSEAVSKFGNKLPTKVQFEELVKSCTWSSTGSGYKVTGPNGQSIVLPAAGHLECNDQVYYVGWYGQYWSSTPSESGDCALIHLEFDVLYKDIHIITKCDRNTFPVTWCGLSVRLVANP
ncbi:MAG: hypothetical protein PUF10_00080 [Bacteroidales bacterium]|nr:hypothetical protein [Bacteroidales bacterium]